MLTSPLISFKFKFKLLWFYLTFFWTCFRLACGSEHICDLVTTGVRLKLQGILHWDDSLLIVVDGQVYDLDLANEQRQKELARDHTMMMYNLGANEKVRFSAHSFSLASFLFLTKLNLFSATRSLCSRLSPTNLSTL